MFSEAQVKLAKKMAKNGELDLYIDATGSVIQSIKNQKRPYIYSVVVKPTTSLPPVSVADMLSTEHTIPRIELFLNTFNRAINKGNVSKVRKIETDQSLALIQACLKTFNMMDMKTYLRKCWSIFLTEEITGDITVHHLCAAHIIRDFIKKIKVVNLDRHTRKFVLACFRTLQDTTTLHDDERLFRRLVYIFKSKIDTPLVKYALEMLKKEFTANTEDLDPENDSDAQEECDFEELPLEATIRQSSPFQSTFEEVQNSAERDIGSVQTSKETFGNKFFNQDIIQILMEKYMYTLPMWTRSMLHIVSNSKELPNEVHVRTTNDPAENWFRIVKHDLGLGQFERPAKLIIVLQTAISSIIKELQFPGCREKSSRRKRRRQADHMDEEETVEEKWDKKIIKKKRKVLRSERKDSRLKTTSKNSTNQCKPKSRQKESAVPQWGGQIEGRVLSNTCTIDNGLTILHNCYVENENFRNLLSRESSSTIQTI